MNPHTHRKIFISYRREDSEGWAGHIAEKLQVAFGDLTVFYDYDAIGPSSKWADAIALALEQCRLLLAIIGPRWVSIRNTTGERRLDAPHDIVRLEISSALKRRIPILPVLVGKAALPLRRELPLDLAGILEYQFIELPTRSWKREIEVLLNTAESILGETRRKMPSHELPTAEVAEGLLLENTQSGSIVGVRASHPEPIQKVVVAKRATIRDVAMKDIVGFELIGKRKSKHAR